MKKIILFVGSFAILFTQCHPSIKSEVQVKLHTIRLLPGQDVKQELDNFIKGKNIEAAFILSAVGSLTQFHLRFANKAEGTKEVGFFEVVSLTGLLSVHGHHVHMSVSDATGKTIGGHLLDENLVYTTLEVVIGEDTTHKYLREIDATYGYKELLVKPR